MAETDIGDDRLGPYGDQFYEQLMRVHEGLETEASVALNARLILLMANEIGDTEKLEGLIKAARNN